MHDFSHRLRTAAVAGAAIVLAAATASAQQGTGDFHYEKQLGAGARVELHNLDGDVSVVPSTSGKVEITGRKTRNGDDRVHVEVHETSNGLIACVMWDDMDGSCDEDGYHIHGDDGWRRRGSMDLEVRVPANVRVSAASVSGDVSVEGAQGDVRASSVSGSVKLRHLHAASLRATSVSGDVDAQIDAFDGSSGDISAKSVSGDVTLEMPKALDADVSVSTVSGQIDSDYPMTLNGRMSRRRVEARIGKGGRDLDISTVSGDVRLRAAK